MSKTQEIAGNIDALKALSGATDEQLGAICGIHGNSFSKRLRAARDGSGGLDVETIDAIARAAGVPYDVLSGTRAGLLAWLAEHQPNVQFPVIDLTRERAKHRSGWNFGTVTGGLTSLGLSPLDSLQLFDTRQVIDLR